ncbi:vegetative insecticidal protein Vip3A family protein [Bacillus thuringiensis]|uniref:vegetative insecticidal protein Vip3A family protein n=1 Tax=Bacillus thuringiensis TaxID=1428 RepID=UPI0032B064F6
MVTTKMIPRLKALPDFIDDFNGVYGFMNNISDLIGTIFGINTGDSSLDAVLENQELLQQMMGQMNTIQSTLDDIMENQSISEDVLLQLRSLAGEQLELSKSINTELVKIEGILNTYLPAISSMVNKVYSQTSMINQKVDKLLQLMAFALQELDYLKDNVVLNSSIIEITPHVQKLVYVNSKFLALSRNYMQGKGMSIDRMQELIQWAKSIVDTDMNSFEFSVDTLHSVIMGDNLYKKSALATFADVLLDDTSQYGDFGTPVAKFYTFYSSLATLQINAYLCLTFARKVLGLTQIEYQITMQERIRNQNQLFINLIEDKNVSSYLEVKGIADQLPVAKEIKSFDLQAKGGYAFIGLEFILDGDEYKAKAYQAKVDKNFSVHAETVEEIISDNLMEVFTYYYLDPGMKYVKFPLSGKLTGATNTLITRIGFGCKNNQSQDPKVYAYIDADFSPYNPYTGEIMKEGTQTISLDGSEDTVNAYGIWPMGLLGDLYMAPLKSLFLSVDADNASYVDATDAVLNFGGESYLPTILSKEYDANFIMYSHIKNTDQMDMNMLMNGDFEKGVDNWSLIEPMDLAEGEGVNGSNALKGHLGASNGKAAQSVYLEPNTTYKLKAYGKVDADGSKGEIGIQDIYGPFWKYQEFSSLQYTPVELEFKTSDDTLNLCIYYQSRNGTSWIDNFELFDLTLEKGNLIANPSFIFGGISHWIADEGVTVVEGKGMFNSNAAQIKGKDRISQQVSMKPNTHYQLEAYVKVDNANTTAQIGYGQNYVTCNSTSFTPITVKFSTGDSPLNTEDSVYCANTSNQGTVWADNFVLHEAPNLIVNGDFKQLNPVASWTLSPSENGDISIVPKGIGILNKGQISQKVKLKSNTKYTLTAYIAVYGGVAKLGYGDTNKTCTSKDFTQVSVDFVTSSNPNNDSVYLSNENDGNCSVIGNKFELYESDQI